MNGPEGNRPDIKPKVRRLEGTDAEDLLKREEVREDATFDPHNGIQLLPPEVQRRLNSLIEKALIPNNSKKPQGK